MRRHSLTLADRYAAQWDAGVDTVARELLQIIDPGTYERLREKERADRIAARELPEITEAAEMTRLVGGTYGFMFLSDTPTEDEVSAIGGFEKELCDWSDIWWEMDPLEHREAESHIGRRLAEIGDMGWSAYGRIEMLRIDKEKLPFAVVSLVRGKPRGVFRADEGLYVVRQ